MLRNEVTMSSFSIFNPLILISPQMIHLLFSFDRISTDLSRSLLNVSSSVFVYIVSIDFYYNESLIGFDRVKVMGAF